MVHPPTARDAIVAFRKADARVWQKGVGLRPPDGTSCDSFLIDFVSVSSRPTAVTRGSQVIAAKLTLTWQSASYCKSASPWPHADCSMPTRQL
jgi:hypothetical protein